MGTIFDEHSFTNTAKAVYAINDSIREHYGSADELENYMYSEAYSHSVRQAKRGLKPTFFSTGGFCLTFFECTDGNTHCVATVMAYTVQYFLEKLKDLTDFLED